MNKNNGGPAFPGVATWDDGCKSFHGQIHGMTLRDWFAGKSLAAYRGRNDEWAQEQTPERLAVLSYEDADAMLAEREK